MHISSHPAPRVTQFRRDEVACYASGFSFEDIARTIRSSHHITTTVIEGPQRGLSAVDMGNNKKEEAALASYIAASRGRGGDCERCPRSEGGQRVEDLEELPFGSVRPWFGLAA